MAAFQLELARSPKNKYVSYPSFFAYMKPLLLKAIRSLKTRRKGLLT